MIKIQKRHKILFSAAIFALMLAWLTSGFSSSAFAGPNEAGEHVTGQVLVKFKAGTTQDIVEKTIKQENGRAIGKLNELDAYVLSVPTQAEEKIALALAHNPRVEYAELNYLAEASAIVNDTYFGEQWGLENSNDADIDAPEAWDKTTGVGVVVAILDTGVSRNHPDLSSHVIDRTNFTDSSTDDDIAGHGTHVGGIVAAQTNNGHGVAGVCPDCQLMSVKVLNDVGSGAYSWIANGIVYATDHGAKVINLSLGGSQKSTTLENAVKYAWNHGVVVVAAAGNSGNVSKSYPAAYENAIAVAATDNQDKKAYFSQYGSWVDVAAPGLDIYSAWNDSDSGSDPQPSCFVTNDCYKFASGTSMSTPMTAGVVGLIWSTNQYSTASEVRARLEQTADRIPGTGNYWSAGRINADHAVDSNYVIVAPSPTIKPGRNK